MLPSVSPISCFNRLNESVPCLDRKYDGGHARPVLQQRIETVECFPPAGRGLRRDRLWGDE